MFALQQLLSVDPSIGRVDYSLMSDQTLMEMLIDGIDDNTKNKYKDNDGIYLDVCEWACIKCDEDQRVIEIVTSSTNEGSNLTGSIKHHFLKEKKSMWRLFLLLWTSRNSCHTGKHIGLSLATIFFQSEKSIQP